jgi:hypothetical protein
MSNQGVQRVYIGGFDPPRLTTDQVIERLLSSLKDAVEIQDIYRGSCYCHMNVLSRHDDITALEVITKTFNNVKWKGCKLRVEAAKPHFLVRLSLEIEQRNHHKKEAAAIQTQTERSSSVQTIPRHLKIRKRHGDESWKVDTKPCRVTDWPSFVKMKRKLHNQMDEKISADKSKKLKSVMSVSENRALHLVFDTDVVLNRSSPMVQRDDESGEATVSVNSASTSTSSLEKNTQRTGAYAWSDDNVNDSSSQSGGKMDTSTVRNNPIQVDSDAYVWSDDASSGSSSAGGHFATKSTKRKTLSGPNAMEEFESAANFDDVPDDEESVSVADPLAFVDLEQDVKINLGVLTQLFPDVMSKPIAVNATEQSASEFKRGLASGWDLGGQMVRFDPSNASADQYLLPSDKRAAFTMKPDLDQEAKIDVTHAEITTKGIYEEAQLESVFREAREVVATTGDGFSFGFNLPDPPALTSAASVSFLIGEPSRNTEFATKTASPLAVTDSPSLLSPKRRRLHFGTDELDDCVENFFTLSDGRKIQEDLERYRNDPEVKEHWLQERKTLTLDWKRKRKHAVSRQSKRLR